MRELVAVAIPVWREPPPQDYFCFRRCVETLADYPLVLLAPESLDCGTYLEAAPQARIERFADELLNTLRGYQTLKLTPPLYERLRDFEYLLCHELDAFVFQDTLSDWCARGYDYIGGPMRPGTRTFPTPPSPLVGNGGLSLRRIDAHLRVLASSQDEPLRARAAACLAAPRWLLRRPRPAGPHERPVERRLRLFAEHGWPEDHFWSVSAERFDRGFRRAPIAEAAAFSLTAVRIEARGPRFGCHGKRRAERLYAMLELGDEPRTPADELLLECAALASAACPTS